MDVQNILEKHGDKVSVTALILALVLGGGNLIGSLGLVSDDEFNTHIASQQTVNSEQSRKIDRLLVESLRQQIVSYQARICAMPNSPSVSAWQRELDRLLDEYRSTAGRAFPPELLDCD